jgi:hypothetical protein
MWLLICIAVLLVNIYLIIGIIGLILGALYTPWRYPFLWNGPQGWGGLIFAAIISILFYPHCGFLHLPVG